MRCYQIRYMLCSPSHAEDGFGYVFCLYSLCRNAQNDINIYSYVFVSDEKEQIKYKKCVGQQFQN